MTRILLCILPTRWDVRQMKTAGLSPRSGCWKLHAMSEFLYDDGNGFTVELWTLSLEDTFYSHAWLISCTAYVGSGLFVRYQLSSRYPYV